jgi:nicotinamide mononucleotide transporter
MDLEEMVAVAVSVVAVWLTTRRSLWNYPFAFASVGLYAHIFHTVKLYADMALQVVFAITLAYGLAEWRSFQRADGTVVVTRAPRSELLAGILLGVCGALILGWFMATRTDAALPWLDAALTAASLVGSWWAARRRIENWALWIAADVVYVGVFLYKGLRPTAALYAAFVALAVLGLRRWQVALEGQLPEPVVAAAASRRRALN